MGLIGFLAKRLQVLVHKQLGRRALEGAGVGGRLLVSVGGTYIFLGALLLCSLKHKKATRKLRSAAIRHSSCIFQLKT